MNVAGMNAPGSRLSLLPLVLALYMVAYVVRVADRLPLRAAGPGSVGLGSVALAPRCAALCKIAMGVTMGYTLILML